MRETSDREQYVSLPAWRGRIVVAICMIAGLVVVAGFAPRIQVFPHGVHADGWSAAAAKSSTRHLYHLSPGDFVRDSGGPDDAPDPTLAVVAARFELGTQWFRLTETEGASGTNWGDSPRIGGNSPRAPPAA